MALEHLRIISTGNNINLVSDFYFQPSHDLLGACRIPNTNLCHYFSGSRAAVLSSIRPIYSCCVNPRLEKIGAASKTKPKLIRKQNINKTL